MIKIYGMNTCPHCQTVYRQVKGDNRYEIMEIGGHVSVLKEFLRLRDSSPVFDEARRKGQVGIPCFVLEDGTVTLTPEDAGLRTDVAHGPSCNIDGPGC